MNDVNSDDYDAHMSQSYIEVNGVDDVEIVHIKPAEFDPYQLVNESVPHAPPEIQQSSEHIGIEESRQTIILRAPHKPTAKEI